jgi:hypothetical protein
MPSTLFAACQNPRGHIRSAILRLRHGFLDVEELPSPGPGGQEPHYPLEERPVG